MADDLTSEINAAVAEQKKQQAANPTVNKPLYDPTTNTINIQTKAESTIDKAPPPEDKNSVLGIPSWLPGGTEKKGAVPRQLAEGFWGGIEKMMEAGQAASMGEGKGGLLPVSALRLFLPARWVNAMTGVTPPDQTGELQKMFVDSETVDDGQGGYKVVQKPTEPSGKLNEAIAPAIRGVGGALPFMAGGNVAANIMMGAGAGELGHYGADLGHRVDVAMGNDTPIGEEIGGLTGGAVGGYANLTRAKAMGELAKGALKVPKDAYDAVQTAREMKRQGDTRNLTAIIGDNYSTLRADSLNFLQQHVMEKFADVLRQDPNNAPALEAFNKAAADLGIDPTKFNIAQQTANPTLVKTVEFYRPKDLEEQNTNIQAKEGEKQALSSVYKRLLGDIPKMGASDVVGALEDFRKTVNLQNARFDELARQAKQPIASFTPEDHAQAGAQIKDMFANAEAKAKQQVRTDYAMAEAADAALGTPYNLKSVAKEVNSMVAETMAKVDPTTVPASIRNFANLIAKSKGATPDQLTLLDSSGKPMHSFDITAAGKDTPITLKDINDAVVAINEDMAHAERADNRAQFKSLARMKAELDNVIDTQSPPAVRALYRQAQENYRTLYVPRFRTGENYNLSREGGLNKLNEDFRTDESALPNYLTPGGRNSATAMRQFDDLFGGRITGEKPNVQAYQALARTLEDRYNKTVLGKSKFDVADHDQFLQDYAPVVNSIEKVIPDFRKKLDHTAEMLQDVNVGKENAAAWYKDVVNGPVDKTIGYHQAGRLFTEALSDPRKMGQLMRAVGKENIPALVKEAMDRGNPFIEDQSMGGRLKLDPKKMDVLLESGRAPNDPNSASSAQVLFREAFGKAEGDAHFQRLRQISALSKRIDLTQLKFDKPTETIDVDPGKSMTGQSAASWLTQYGAVMRGQQSPFYLGVLGGGRFLNSKIRGAIEDATRKALYDPETSKAILEMVQTPPDQPITAKTANKVFGKLGKEGEDLIARLTSQGYIRGTLAKGASIANTQEDERRSRGIKR